MDKIKAAFMFTVLLGTGFTVWLRSRTVGDFHSQLLDSYSESDLERFDCHPDRPIKKSACLARGCVYSPSSDLNVTDADLIKSSFIGVPSCYFPQDYRGYFLSGGTISDNISITADFRRGISSGFPRDMQALSLYVQMTDDETLKISITDAKSKRFRPDVPIQVEEKPGTKRLYDVKLHNNGVLQVRRKDLHEIVFETDISRLIFSDQFIQISTSLPSKYVYGLGEHKEGILKSTNWTRYTLFNQGDLPVPNRNLYGSHPFYMVLEPGGFATGVFLLNSNAMDYILQPTPALTIRTIGGMLEFYILLGPEPKDVVRQYTMLFGKPNFPPRWSLGFQLSRYGYFTLDKMKEALQRNLDKNIPVDVQWSDIDYMDRHLDFTYDPVNFTGLPEYLKDLHNRDMRYIAMISPGLSNTEKEGTYPAYDEAKSLDLFIKNTKGEPIQGKVWNENYSVFPDFSNPKTEEYWIKQFQEFHKKLDFDGVWIDMNEPLNFLNGSNEGCPASKFDEPPYVPGYPFPLKTLTLCMSAKHYETEHYNEHNLLAYREAKATHAAMSKITKKRPFIISRATFSGQGVYSGHWSGDITSDWDDLRYTIPAMLAFSLYGMPMTGSDICGFRENTTLELCTRWQSLGAFYPFSRNHNDFDTIEQDPAAMGDQVVQATKNALQIRYYLLPYLYTLFYRNHMYGETVARPLFFEFPFDSETYTIDDEFLLGPALLIMPALEEGVKVINPYVPTGLWYTFDGKEYTTEGENITLEAPLTDINVFLRGGYIFPAQKPGKTVAETAKNPFDILVALETRWSFLAAEGQLFWDDGESIDSIEKENYMLLDMVANGDNSTCEVFLKTAHKGFVDKVKVANIKVYGIRQKPANVTVNGKNVEFTYNQPHPYLNINANIEYNIEDNLKAVISL